MSPEITSYACAPVTAFQYTRASPGEPFGSSRRLRGSGPCPWSCGTVTTASAEAEFPDPSVALYRSSYVLPAPLPERSARSRISASDEPASAESTSSVVAPSSPPGASSGSLLVTETRRTAAAGSQRSLTCQAGCTGTRRWFGGHSVVRSVVSVREGTVVSRTVTPVEQVATFPDASVAVKVTWVAPSG